MNSKRITTLLGFVCVLALALSIPSTLVAGEKGDKNNGKNHEAENSGNGCKLQGTWLADWPVYGITFFITHHGTGANDGTSDAEWITVTTPAPGISISGARGVWAKSGPNTFDLTLRTFFTVGPQGNIAYMGKFIGAITLTDCNTYSWAGITEYWEPGATEPFMLDPAAGSAQRMVQEEPFQPQP